MGQRTRISVGKVVGSTNSKTLRVIRNNDVKVIYSTNGLFNKILKKEKLTLNTI